MIKYLLEKRSKQDETLSAVNNDKDQQNMYGKPNSGYVTRNENNTLPKKNNNINGND